MHFMKRSTDGRPRVPLAAVLTAAVLLTTAVVSEAAAQSDAGTVTASVTVQTDAITVTGIQDLAFGTHFASEGVVPNEQPAVWQIDVSTDPTNVDLTLTVLPSELLGDPVLPGVPLLYGPDSFSALCAGIMTPGDPFVGITGCEITPGAGIAELGDTGAGFAPVEADLSGASPGTYTATVELTATIN